MSQQVRYGDQLYIEISNLDPPPKTETRLFCSNGFLDNPIFGVTKSNVQIANFRSCIFTILPSLVDCEEDTSTVQSLRTELSILSRHKLDTSGEKYLSDEIARKQKSIEERGEDMEAINQKILLEMGGKEINYGTIILLQHLESGYYLCAESSFHPYNPTLYNLKLVKDRNPACYFKFFSYLSSAERTAIDFDSEMKLVSVHLNTVVALDSFVKGLNDCVLLPEEGENLEVKEKPICPPDAIRRTDILGSFDGDLKTVGTRLECKANHRVKLIEYCSNEQMISYTKKKMIKNGDYIRLHINDFYLTATKTLYQETLGLVEQKVEGYKHSLINSIFQIVKIEQDHDYPHAEEIKSVQKGTENGTNVDKFYLRHLPTGQFLSLPKENLYCAFAKEHPEKMISIPYFCLVHDNATPTNILTQNSRVCLKVFKNSSDDGQFYSESEVEKLHPPGISDLSTKAFCGFKNPQEKIKIKMKSVTKPLQQNPVIGSFFKVSLVTDEETRKIHEFEAHFSALKRFMDILHASIKGNPKAKEVFDSELYRILKCSEVLRSLSEVNSPQTQILVREFRILDIMARFLYYFFVDKAINPILDANRFEMEPIVELMLNFCNILLNTCKGNELSSLYVSQYVRLFINAILDPTDIYVCSDRIQAKKLKDTMIVMLHNFLHERDLNSFGQLYFYEKQLFESLDKHDDYSTHLLKILNYYLGSDCPNLYNQLRIDFINKYIGDPVKLRKIFPKISIEGQEDFQIEFERKNYPTKALLSDVGVEVEHYLIFVFRLIASTTKARSLKFSKIIMNYYGIDICDALLNSPKVPAKLKNSILLVFKNLYMAYNKLPFDRIDPKIQIMFKSELVKKHEDNFNNKIRQAELTLISDLETNLIQLDSPRRSKTLPRYSTKELSTEIIGEGCENIRKGTLEQVPFALQVMQNLLQEEIEHKNGTSGHQNLCAIHHSMCILLENIAKESQQKEGLRNYYNFFLKNNEVIFAILGGIDKVTVKLAFKESLERIKDRFLSLHSTDGKDHLARVNPVLEVIVARGLATGIHSSSSMQRWKSKERLYELANRSADEVPYTECQLREFLWKIAGCADVDIASQIVNLIKKKADFENEINKEISESVVIAEEKEINNFEQLVTSLLELNRIERKLRLITEFEVREKEGEQTLDQIINHLETVFLLMYDYETHMEDKMKDQTKKKRKDENTPASDKETARKSFLKRYRYCKVTVKNEVPFSYKDCCVSRFYQKIMKILKSYEIIVPLVRHLGPKKNAFSNASPEKFKLATCYVYSIIALFLYKNRTNQLVMSTYPEFITIFYDDEILNTSPETIFMFTELIRDNKKLLLLNKDYLFNFVLYDYLDYFGKPKLDVEIPKTLNYVRSLSVIFSASIPKDTFNPAQFMIDTFSYLLKVITLEHTISLSHLILQTQQRDFLKSTNFGIKTLLDGQENTVEMPVCYTVFKEFLECLKEFALTDDTERVFILQNNFRLEAIIPWIKNENIQFNFEIKHLLLQILENIFFKNKNRNTNIFKDYDHFKSFVTLFFLDIYGFLKYETGIETLTDGDEAFDMFTSNLFSSPKNQIALKKYDSLLKSLDLTKYKFMQYQSVIKVKEIWENYIYYMLCEFFGNLVGTYQEFMLSTKGMSHSSCSIFETWLRLVIKLRRIDKDENYRSMIDKALKEAVVHPEYAYHRDWVYSILDNNTQTSKTATSKINSPLDPLAKNTVKDTLNTKERVLNKSQSTLNADANDHLARIVGDQPLNALLFTEINLKSIAEQPALDKSVLTKLINMLKLPETPIRILIFILKLLRKFIEVENETEKDGNKPIYLWDGLTDKELQNIHVRQNVLAELGIIDSLFNLLYQYQQDKVIFEQVLLLCLALLYGGNRNVQKLFYEQFKEDSDGEILNNFAQILEDTLEYFRISEGKKTRQAYLQTLKFLHRSIKQKNLKFEMVGDTIQVSDEKGQLVIDHSESQELSEITTTSTQWEEYKLMLIILEFFQNLCEGHNSSFQEFLRDQTIAGHSKSFNVPDFLRQAYSVYYKYINASNIETGVKILDMLIEMQQGASEANVDLLLKKTFISDLCNTLTGFNTDLDLLSRGFGFDNSHEKFMQVKSKVLIILKDLIERSDPRTINKLNQFIDLKALVATFRDNVIAFHNKKKGLIPNRKTYELKDMWDPNLSSAFLVYFILKQLSYDQPSSEFTPEINDMLRYFYPNSGTEKTITDVPTRYLLKFFPKFTGSIEIIQKRSSKLMRIYFPIPVAYSYLKKDTKMEFADRVDRTSTQSKIADLMDASTELIGQMYREYNSRSRIFGLNFSLLYTMIRFFTNVISIIVVFNDLFGLVWTDEEGPVYKGDYVNQINDSLSIVQAILAGILIVLWLETKLGRFLVFKWDEFCTENVKEMGPLSLEYVQKLNDEQLVTKELGEAVLKLKGPYSDEWKVVESKMGFRLNFYNFYFSLQSGALVWHCLYLGICIGSIFHPLATAFQIFDIIVRSDTVYRISLAVSRNLRQFIWTLILLLVSVYVYTLIGFYYLHPRYDDADVDNLCPDAYSCYLASLNFGLRNGGGIADSLKKIKYGEVSQGYYFGITLFDLSFFIFMIVLMLNLIFGMIIDAFGDLRDEKTANDDDKENICFICGLSRSEYERVGRFEEHKTKEHNMWEYIAYLIYLREKKEKHSTEFTDIEDYVSDRCDKKDYIWIPIGRSLTLERQLAKEEKERKTAIDKLRDEMMSCFESIQEQNKKLNNRLDSMEKRVENVINPKKMSRGPSQKHLSPTKIKHPENNQAVPAIEEN